MVTLSPSYQQARYDSPTGVGAESHEKVFQRNVNSRIEDLNNRLESLKRENAQNLAKLHQPLQLKTNIICMNCGIYGHLPYNCESPIEQINAFQNFRHSTSHKLPSSFQNSTYINPPPTPQFQNPNYQLPQQPFFPPKKPLAPHTPPLPNFNLEFRDLRNVLLKIKSNQERLSEKVTRIEKETHVGFSRLEEQVEELKRFKQIPFQNIMNLNGVETVIESMMDGANRLSIARIEGTFDDTVNLTSREEIGMVEDGESSKHNTQVLTGVRTDRPIQGTDRFCVAIGDGDSIFDEVFQGSTGIEKLISSAQPLEAVTYPYDMVNDSLDPIICENFMNESTFNRNTFVSAFNVLRDPGTFTLDVAINRKPFQDCVLDTGASMNTMPYRFAKAAGIDDTRLKPLDKMVMRLADGTDRKPKGLAINVPVDVEGRVMQFDFVLVESIEESHIILGRPFLYDTQAKLQYEDMSVELNIDGTWLTYKKKACTKPMEFIGTPRSPSCEYRPNPLNPLHCPDFHWLLRLEEETPPPSPKARRISTRETKGVPPMHYVGGLKGEMRRFKDGSRKRKRDNPTIVIESGDAKNNAANAKGIETVQDPEIEKWLDEDPMPLKFETDDDSEDDTDTNENLSACSSSTLASPHS